MQTTLKDVKTMFLRKPNNHLRGFTLIELAIVLGVVGVLGASLWRLMSTSNQTTKDQNTAQQQQQLISAVKGYLASSGTGEGQNWMQADLGSPLPALANLPLPTAAWSTVAACQANLLLAPNGSDGRFGGFCNFLPPGTYYNPATGAGTTNPYGQAYTIQVLKDASPQGTAPQTYSFMIIATGTVIPDVDGGRISGMIGGDGGFVYSSSTVCGSTSPTACGALGAWSVSTVTYGFAAAGGSIASRSFISPSADNSNLWLAREHIPSDTTNPPTLNTMTTNLYMQDGTTFIGAGSASISLQGTGLGTSSPAAADNPEALIAGDMTLQDNPSGTANPLLRINSNSRACAQTGASAQDSQSSGFPCQYAVVVNGDFQDNGLVYADVFYSNQFGYLGSSDRRLKKDIKTLSDPLADVMKINPVSFAYKSTGNKNMGVIAQELEDIYPILVKNMPDGYKAVNYDGLIAPIIGAVQELKKDNDNLQKQNDDLRTQLLEFAEHQKKIDQQLEKLSQQ